MQKNAAYTRKTIKAGDPSTDAVYAVVDNGRWIAKCECNGAEYVDPDYPLFFCCSCGNKSTDSRLRPVIFPGDMKKIETELLSRKDTKWQSWDKTQTLSDLKSETKVLEGKATSSDKKAIVDEIDALKKRLVELDALLNEAM